MSSPLRPGRSFGERYEILEIVAGGGMADVFRALDARVRRSVIIKCQREDDVSGTFRERFRREIEVLGSVQHPFVLPILDAGVLDDERVWLALPFVRDRCIRHQTDVARRVFTHAEARQIGLDVCEALGAVHAGRWIHRDVKPANVLVSGSHFLLADFGIASMIDQPSPNPAGTACESGVVVPRDGPLTLEGMVMGTAEYLSPARYEGRPAAPSDDSFSLAVMLFQLLVGVDPFEGMFGNERYFRMLRKPPLDPQSLKPDLPDAWAELLLRVLDRSSDSRIPDADEMRLALLTIEVP